MQENLIKILSSFNCYEQFSGNHRKLRLLLYRTMDTELNCPLYHVDLVREKDTIHIYCGTSRSVAFHNFYTNLFGLVW